MLDFKCIRCGKHYLKNKRETTSYDHEGKLLGYICVVCASKVPKPKMTGLPKPYGVTTEKKKVYVLNIDRSPNGRKTAGV